MITMTPVVATPIFGTRVWVELVAPKPRRTQAGVSFHNYTAVSATTERRHR